MSYTEIVGLTKNGVFYSIGETRNSWLGAMAVWEILEKRYLPEFIPEWARLVGVEDKNYSRFSGTIEDLEAIWDLINDDRVTLGEKIVLYSTFDKALVKVENINKLLKAFNEFGGNTTLKEQAEVISEALKEDPNIIAIGWNQTSVNENKWLKYNFEEDKEHFFIFDNL